MMPATAWQHRKPRQLLQLALGKARRDWTVLQVPKVRTSEITGINAWIYQL
jgi:hypothetical protein